MPRLGRWLPAVVATAAAVATADAAPTRTILLQHEQSARAINHASRLQHHEGGACLSPPKVGRQCTMLLDDALRGCLGQAGCHSFTCPPTDKDNYGLGKAAGIIGEIKTAIVSIRQIREKNTETQEK